MTDPGLVAPRVTPVTLEGRWVRLEPLGRQHAGALVRAASGDRSTFGYTRVPTDEAGMLVYIERALENQRMGQSLPLATFDATTGLCVGATRFINIECWEWPAGHPGRERGGAPDAVEIGSTWLGARAQRTAVNSEAKLLMLGHAFETWGVRRVRLRTDARNARSRAAIERLGARLDGILRAHEAGADGAVRDSAMYSMLAAEWPEARERLESRLLTRV